MQKKTNQKTTEIYKKWQAHTHTHTRTTHMCCIEEDKTTNLCVWKISCLTFISIERGRFFPPFNTKHKRVIHFYPFHCNFLPCKSSQNVCHGFTCSISSSFFIWDSFAFLFNIFFCLVRVEEKTLPPEFTFHWSNSPKQNIRIHYAVLCVCVCEQMLCTFTSNDWFYHGILDNVVFAFRFSMQQKEQKSLVSSVFTNNGELTILRFSLQFMVLRMT